MVHVIRTTTYRYVLALLLFAVPALAQPIGPPASISGTISSTTCSGTPGSGTGCVVLNVTGYASAAVQVSAIGTQTIGFFGSINGTDYTAIPGTLMSTGATASTTTTTGLWLFSLGGAKYLKVAGTAYTSGTASVYVQTAASGGGTGGGGGGGASSTVTINDPTTPTQKAAVNASGQLSITCANCSGSGASSVDESVFTQGTNSVAPAGIFFTNAYTNLTSGQAGVVQGTANGSMFVNLDKIQGTNTDVNSGNKSAGTLRVVLATDQPQLTNALKVDGSAVTQPVSAASLPLPAGASTSANQTNRTQQTQLTDGAGNARSANVTAANALVVDGSAVTQPVSGTVTTTPPANASTNVTQLAGNAITTNTGTAAAGTQRIVIATDQPQLTNALKVDGSAVTQPVSGTVTANAGSGTFTNQQSNVTADFDTGAGTQTTTMFGLALPASGGAVPGGTATNPIQVSLANTASNATAVKVDGSAVTQPVSGTVTTTPPSNASTNVTQFGGVNVSTGTGASGTGIPRVTVANDSNILATQSGTWTTQPGNTANTTPWLFTVNQGGNSATVTASNALKVDGSAVTQPVSGTVTANIGTTNGLALDASVTGLQVAQGSTTAGEKGGLALGAVTTAAPSYTTAQTSPLSLTTAGGLRVDGSGTTQPVSGTVAATQSGTWTVQPGNTANTTPWLTSISQGGNTAAVNASSQLSVNCANCSGSGVSQQDNTGFTPGTTNVAPIGAEVDDVGTTPVTENSAGGLRMSTRREMYTQIRDAAGNERGVNVTAGNAMSVDGSAVTQPVSLATGASADLTQLLIDQRRQTTQILDGLKKVRLTDRIGAFIDPRQTRLLTALDIVTCANCSAGAGTSIVDNAAFTQSSTSETPVSGLYTTSYTAATSGRSTVLRMSSSGDAYVNVNLLQGAVPSATNYLPFRPTDGTNYITPSTDYTHDGALTPASTTGPMGMWRASSSTPTAVSAADDAVMGWADLNGRPQVNISQIGGTGLFSNNGTASGSTFVATLPAVATTAAPSYTDGRMVTLSTDLSGALRVSGGSGGTSITDNAAFTQSTTTETPVSGLYTTSYTAATSGRSTVLQMTSAGEAYINISKLQGAVPSATNYLPFRPTDGTNYITPSTDYTHDGALTPASTTGPMGLWRASTATPTAVSADDDAVMGWADRNGRPQVNTSQIAGVTPTLGDVNNAAAIAGVQNVGAVARYNATLPTLTDTRYNLFQVGSRGGLNVNILDANGTTGAGVTATGLKVDVGGAGALTATSSALDTNLKLVGGNAVSTVASGVAKVGIADSGGTAFLSAANALNSTGGGVQAVQTVAQFDDVAPTAITENQFGNLRMSANRNAYTTIRDAAGNERGVNVSAGNALLVDGSATTQPVSGTVTTTPPANASTNVTQFASTNVSTGTGASGAGIPRVTVANDSNILATQSGTWTVQPGNTANTTPWLSTISQGGNAATVSAGGALKVDGSAVTQPVSGTVTANQGGAPWAENITQFGSSAVVTGTGVGGAGIPRMTVSSDSTLTSIGSITNTVTDQGTKTNNNAAPGATNFGTLPGVATAASPTYVEGNQVALSTDLTGALRVSGSSGGGVAQTQVRNQSNTWTDVGYASGDTTMPITASAVEALLAQLIRNEQAQQNYVRGAFGNKIGSVNDALKVNVVNSPGRYDPCQGPKSNVAISQAANGVVLTNIPGRVLFCSLVIVAADAENLSLVEGSGATCGTGTAALIGGTTAANGPNLAANGGWSEGGSGYTIAPQIKVGNDVCLFQSGSGRVAGHATYVVVPQ